MQKYNINIYLYIPILLFASCLSGCFEQFKKTETVPEKFSRELQKLEGQYEKPTFINYTIKPGDTVWKVSMEYGVLPERIVELNNITDVKNIKPGKVLLIPDSTSVSASPQLYNTPQIIKDQLVSKQGFIWPLKHRIISYFGDYQNGFRNTGIDIEAKPDEDVLAAKDGRVVVVSNNPEGWGKVIVIEHSNGINTWYAYNSSILVNKDMRVKQGQVIAKAGQGSNDKRTKLHFKLFVNEKPVDPLSYLPR